MSWKGWSFCRIPEHAISEETWNGGDGKIRFNHVQQSVPDVDYGLQPRIDIDPWNIVPDSQIYRGPSSG